MPRLYILLLLAAFLNVPLAHAEKEFYAVKEIKLRSRIAAQGEPNGIQLFSVPEGSKVFVKQRSGDWVLVETPEGKGGWAAKDDIGERDAISPEGPTGPGTEGNIKENANAQHSANDGHQHDAEEEDNTDLYDCLEELEKITEPAEFQQVITALEQKFPGISFSSPIQGRACVLSGRRYGCYKHPILNRPRSHDGLDLAAKTGTPLVAPGDDCELVSQQWSSSYGRQVFLKCGAYTFSYNHLSGYINNGRNKSGHKYKKGEVIGFVGTSGRSTGPHLHFEVFFNGSRIDPNSIFDESVLCKAKLELQPTANCSGRAESNHRPSQRGRR